MIWPLSVVLLLFCGSVFFSVCKGTQQTGESDTTGIVNPGDRPPPCSERGVVRNYAGLSGCGWLIEMGNGDLYLASSWPDEATWEWYEGQIIRFSYSIMDDMASICMRERHVIRIHCLTEEGPEACMDTNDPLAAEWMRDIMNEIAPEEVIKYQYEGNPVYFFHVTRCCDYLSYLYSCEGVRLCVDGGPGGGNCGFFKERWSNPVVIFPRAQKE